MALITSKLLIGVHCSYLIIMLTTFKAFPILLLKRMMMMMISSEENLSRANGKFALDNVIFEGRMINEFITNPKCQSQSYFYVVI